MRNMHVDMAKRLIGITTRHFLTWKVKFLNCIEHNELRTDIPGYTTCVLPYPPTPTQKNPTYMYNIDDSFIKQVQFLDWCLKFGIHIMAPIRWRTVIAYGYWAPISGSLPEFGDAYIKVNESWWWTKRTNNLTILTNIKIL